MPRHEPIDEAKETARHIGIVSCSAPGAALCYETICTEAMEAHAEKAGAIEVSLHAHPFKMYDDRIVAQDWAAVAELMLESARKLSGAGANLCISPCNSVHEAFDIVASKSPIPWLHIAEEVAREAQRLGCRRVALLGTAGLMEGPVYPDRFAKFGISWQIPEVEERELIDKYIYGEMVYGKFTDQARSSLLAIIERLQLEHECDALGLCCTELPILIGAAHTSLTLLDSTRILARAALREAMTE
jgi:aspartate racemase